MLTITLISHPIKYVSETKRSITKEVPRTLRFPDKSQIYVEKIKEFIQHLTHQIC